MAETTIDSGLTTDASLLQTIAHPQSVNLLSTFGAVEDLRQKQWQNKLAQSREATGQAYLQGGLNPDGTPNYTGFNQALRANPATAMTALEGSKSGQEIDTQAWAQHMRRLTAGSAGALAVLADNGGLAPRAAINEYYDRMVKDGIIPPEQRDAAERDFTDDPAKNASIVRQRAAQSLQMQQALEATRPGQHLLDVGGGFQPVLTGPSLGPTPGVVTPAGPVVQKGLTPGEQETRVPSVDDRQFLPDGSPNPNYGQSISTPLREIRPGGGGGTGGGPSGAGAPSPTNQPRLGTGGTGGTTTTQQPQQTAGGRPGGSLPTNLPPGATTSIEAANNDWAKAQANRATYQQRTFPINQALELAQSGKLVTGEGAPAINAVKSWLQTRLSSIPGFDAQTLANADFQKLEKYLQQNINTQPMAGQSDARLASAITGNPSAHLDTLALTDVLKATQALLRMEQLAAIDFANQGAPNGQWHNFMGKWAMQHDPRAFLVLKEDQYRSMFEKMTGPERTAYANTVRLIRQNPEIMNTTAMPGH